MDCKEILRKYSRYLLIIFNFLFVLTGIIILSVGISVKAYYHEFDAFLDDKFFYASDLLIVVGVIIFIIAFFGCCGALKDNACMTLTFSTLLIIIFVLEVIVGIGGIILKNKTHDMVEETLNTTIHQYNTTNNQEITLLWDQVQTRFNCCGINNYTDWIFTNTTKEQIPITCCTIPPGTIGFFDCTATSPQIHGQGCLEVFTDYIEGHAVSIESVGLALAIIQLLGIILSCYLAKQIKSDYETV